MKNEATKKATIPVLNMMIEHADKGPSGFWTGDQEGCGNPQIFPEFEKGLKGGRLVQKEHYLCPWNTAVLYGSTQGNVHSGCYYSCSIKKAKYLSTPLIKKFPDKECLFGSCYGEKELVCTYDGTIDFDPEGYKSVVGADRFTYDEYLEVQIKSFHKTRDWFETCFHSIPLGFKGCIEKNTGKRVCFQRIVVEGMYSDGDCFVGKEDHVWMDISGFEGFQVGDCLSFFAEIYRYVKTGNGKQIDFGLRNPEGIKQIKAYELPTDEELMEQEIEQMLCETCYLEEHCNRVSCLRSQNDMRNLKKQMLDVLKSRHAEDDSQ